MFTGIVEHLGSVTRADRTVSGMRLVVDTGPIDGIALGDSIAVNGVCLTAVEIGDGATGFDVVPETIDRSTLGGLSVGARVNLERPMPAAGRFDGHIVQGHVDGVGTVSQIVSDGDGAKMVVDTSPELLRYLVEKGSVTIDGVSLTITGVSETGFSVALIPHTLSVTTLGLRTVGDRVNLEVDVLAKYVERLLGALL